MKTSSLDLLEKAELPPAQARAILKAMESEFDVVHDRSADMLRQLATKEELKTAIAELEGRLTRWVLTCILGQTAVLAGAGYFFLSHFGR